jgi:hypothetical protein
MREVSYTPRPFNPVSGSSLTVGTLAKISDAVAPLLTDIDALNRRLDRLEQRDGSPKPVISEAQP